MCISMLPISPMLWNAKVYLYQTLIEKILQPGPRGRCLGVPTSLRSEISIQAQCA